MLEKIKKLKLAIVAIAIAVAYLMGKQKGKAHEKAQNNKAVLANVQSASRARARLSDPVVADGVRKKYTRE